MSDLKGKTKENLELFELLDQLFKNEKTYNIMKQYFDINRDKLQLAISTLDSIVKEIDYEDACLRYQWENPKEYE